MTVSVAGSRLSREISPLTDHSAYMLFTPSKSGQRLPPRVTAAAGTELAGAFSGGTVSFDKSKYSSLLTELYTPRCFITHAALLGQAFAHCPIFLTAASRRSLARVSVPVWLIILSDQLPIVALVSRYLTNKLIGRRLIPKR